MRVSGDDDRRHAGGEHLPAERESDGNREIRLQAGVDGPVGGADEGVAGGGVPTVIGGDWNVIPEDIDCDKPANWVRDALFQPEPRARYRAMLAMGYMDAFRSLHPA